VVVVKTPIAARLAVAARLASSGERLVEQVRRAAREHERTLATVLETLVRHGVSPLQVSVDALHAHARRAIAAASLVISVGGDGTLLAASHWVTGAALLGVNSAPGSSVGQLTLARRSTFPRLLARIARGTLAPLPVTRLTIALDGLAGRLLPPALNDVLVADERPAATSRYALRLGRRTAEHRSSGLWVATAAGSTAGIRSAGGRPMPLTSPRIQFRARELYRKPGRPVALASGFVPPESELIVESAMSTGRLFVDGARLALRFPFGARAVFRAAEQPLRFFAGADRWPHG